MTNVRFSEAHKKRIAKHIRDAIDDLNDWIDQANEAGLTVFVMRNENDGKFNVSSISHVEMKGY